MMGLMGFCDLRIARANRAPSQTFSIMKKTKTQPVPVGFNFCERLQLAFAQVTHILFRSKCVSNNTITIYNSNNKRINTNI
jgi:hypothetical protein